MSSPCNLLQVRCSNLRILLDSIRRYGPISKRDLQKITGLSWGTVSTLTGELHEHGYIMSHGKQATNIGRKPLELDISPNNYYIVGIDINLSGLCGMVTDLRGRIIREWFRLIATNTYECVMDTLMSLLDEILLRDYAGKTIFGIGVSVQGLVDVNNGISQYIPQIRHWKDVPIKKILEERYGYYTQLMHDPNCLMISEKAYGNNSLNIAQNAVLLRLDNGIGMSILSNGQLHLGANGKAGEFGHIPVDRDGPVCSCGKRGCLEEYASGNGLVRRFVERVNRGEKTSVKIESLSSLGYESLALAAQQGDTLCADLFLQMGEFLGFALGSLLNILNPEMVVLYGGLVTYRGLFYKPLCEQMHAHMYPGIDAKLVFSQLGRNAAAQGAALVVSDHVMETMDFSSGVWSDQPSPAVSK